MEAKDLMIDDYIRCSQDCHGHRVDYISELEGEVGVDGEILSLDMIEPIPLTQEILERNDFKKFPFPHIEGQHQWTWWKNIVTSVTLWCRELNDDTKDGMVLKIEAPISQLCIKVNYVHELQHALHLCEIKKEIEL